MSDDSMEDLEAFRSRAREWIDANLPSSDGPRVADRELQRLMFDSGFAGIAYPREYGGAGLTVDHQKVFFDVAAELGRQVPNDQFTLVSIGIIAPTLLECASHALKLRFLPKLLRGDELWMQLLSEPRGGSDLAGVVTKLTRDGDTYIVNGSKLWSSGAHLCDYGLCLARSDWDAPKHRGLTMVAVPLKDTPGLQIERIRTADGRLGEFCEEFFDDVVVPADNVIGGENNGWAVTRTLLLHERNATGNVGYGCIDGTGRSRTEEDNCVGVDDLVDQVMQRGAAASGPFGTMIAEAYIDSVVGPLTSRRVMTGLRTGAFEGQWGALLTLQRSLAIHHASRTFLALSGADGVAWEGEDVRIDNAGIMWLTARQFGGGTNEMHRNTVSERLLGLPREPSLERDMPFNEVLKLQSKW